MKEDYHLGKQKKKAATTIAYQETITAHNATRNLYRFQHTYSGIPAVFIDDFDKLHYLQLDFDVEYYYDQTRAERY